MFEQHEWWWPEGETFLPAEMARMNIRDDSGRLTYQHHKYRAALACLPADRRRIAIDVGAHVGLWSYYMARDFEHVVAFEPIVEHQACWHANLDGAKNVALVPCGLGAQHRRAGFVRVPSHSGGTYVSPILRDDIELQRLDFFKFAPVDLIKIDCEGFEAFVIAGAEVTLQRNRPVVIVEQSPSGNQGLYGLEPDAALDYLRALGMELVTSLGSDHILRFV